MQSENSKVVTTRSAAETQSVGETWGRIAESGWVIAVSGDLGAGKTQLVKGLARGLGFLGRVHSPTFTLVNEYPGGRLPLYHLDLYRLETPEQIESAGIEEYLDPEGVAVIEWAERLESGGAGTFDLRKRVKRTRWVRIESVSEAERRIYYEDSGD